MVMSVLIAWVLKKYMHGGHGFGVRNAEGERVLEFALANDLVVGNNRFIKRESHLVTYTVLEITGHRSTSYSTVRALSKQYMM